MIKKICLAVLCAFVAVSLGGCFEEEEEVKAPKNDHIIVRNETAVDLNILVKTRLKDDFALAFGKTEQIDFPATSSKFVQVVIKSTDPDWNDCVANAKVGQTVIAFQAHQLIECRAE